MGPWPQLLGGPKLEEVPDLKGGEISCPSSYHDVGFKSKENHIYLDLAGLPYSS